MGGSMGVTQGMLAEFGPERVRNTPISEMAIVGAAIGAAMQGMRPIVEIMYEDFHDAGHRADRQPGGKTPLHVRRPADGAADFRTQGGAGWSPGAQHAQQLEAWFVHMPGLKVVFASTPRTFAGCSGRRSLTTTRSSSSSTGRSTRSRARCRSRDRADPAREGAHSPRGRGRDRGRHRPARARGARGSRAGGAGGRLRRGRRPAHAAAAGRGRARRLGEEDEPLRRRPRGGRARRLRRRGRSGRPVQAFDWLDAPIERVGAKFTPIPFSPVMEKFVVPHAADVLEAIDRTVGRELMATEVKLPRLGQGMESGHDRPLAGGRGRHGREGRAALRGGHRQGDPGGRGRRGRRAAEDHRPGGRSARRDRRSAVIGEAGRGRSPSQGQLIPNRWPRQESGDYRDELRGTDVPAGAEPARESVQPPQGELSNGAAGSGRRRGRAASLASAVSNWQRSPVRARGSDRRRGRRACRCCRAPASAPPAAPSRRSSESQLQVAAQDDRPSADGGVGGARRFSSRCRRT